MLSPDEEEVLDPIVAEIHESREAYAKSFNYDLAAIANDRFLARI